MNSGVRFIRPEAQSRLASVIAHLHSVPDATYSDLMQTFGISSRSALYYRKEAQRRIDAAKAFPPLVLRARGPDRRKGERRAPDRRDAPATPLTYATPVFLNL